MVLHDLAFRILDKSRRILGRPTRKLDITSFGLESEQRVRLSATASSDFAKLFYGHQGRLAHKWLHYLDIYERYFAPYRNTPVRMLEIGVSEGGSLELWRKYFGAEATIFGIDINPKSAARVTAPNQVRIGSQADPDFLSAVVGEMGPPDIILDDGSHVASHQLVSFNTLFPLLQTGGLYVIEDLHCSYFPGFYQHGGYEGGYRRKGTAIEFAKDMIDDMHGWYHGKTATTPTQGLISGIHFYDSMVVIEKRRVERPAHIRIA